MMTSINGSFNINTIREYLLNCGFKIEYQFLVHDFKQFLYNPDAAVQAQLRNQFKDYVNRLATVSVEDGKKFIVLRPEFLPQPPKKESPRQEPPRPPPRRRASTRSVSTDLPKPVVKLREIQDLTTTPGRVKEHASKLNSLASNVDLRSVIPKKSPSMKENGNAHHYQNHGICLARSASHASPSSRDPRSVSHREEHDSDSGSLQPLDPLRKRWMVEACNCNYNNLLLLLREDPRLASFKDLTNGYTALHWAAKFGNLDIIKLIAGTHGVSSNIRSHGGYTPLHLALMFGHDKAADLLMKSYRADPNLRDHTGKRPNQYLCNAMVRTAPRVSTLTSTPSFARFRLKNLVTNRSSHGSSSKQCQ